MPARARHPVPTRITLTTLVAAVASLLTFLPGVAVADPGDDGSTGELRATLEDATRDYNNAKGRYQASKRRQAALDKEVTSLEAKVDALSGKVGEMAAAAYKGSRASTVAVLLEAGSPSDLTESLATVDYLARRDTRQLKEFTDSRDKLAGKRYAVELELRKQRAEIDRMEKRKKKALAALKNAGGGDSTDGPSSGGTSAEPVPRAPDGSWPTEGCTEDDPTTGGCLTPRTRHALEQARQAGFTRYTKCNRDASYGEHPEGRACDFSASAGGFEDQAAYGSDKDYGDRLAGWFVSNSDRLAVMYVIWYRRIWMPGSGWSSYDGSGGASAEHTNHVHVSIQ